MVWNTTFEIKDISLDCTERVIIAYVETSSCGWLSCLRGFLNNLYTLCNYRGSLVGSFNCLSPLTFNDLTHNWLCFVEISLLNRFIFVWCALVV